ncbi:aspartate/glutamate racemase family protein [Candidatus Bathyarchaeota archaeon]|nr:aspartate/glutamate racemase family protein [Candidatus Bathyarchaeota archaeon]
MPAAPDVEIAYRALDRGSATVESYYDEYVGAMDMVEKALRAKEEGFDAIVINCFMNPMMEGLRELLDIPVVGAGEAAVHMASMLGDNFSIIDPGPPHQAYSHRVAAAAGLLHKLKSVRYLNLGVAGLGQDFETVLGLIVEEAVKAVEEDGAHVIVFGCTGMRRYAERLAEEMEKYGVPVVEPITAAVNVAEILVRLRLRQSKVSYPKPPEKKRVF